MKVCSECGEEYRLDVSTSSCADCGGELVVRQLDATGAVLEDEEQGSEPQLPDTDELSGHRVVFSTPYPDDLVRLAEALQGDGIPYRLAEQPGGAKGAPPSYALLVPEGEAASALRTLAPLVAPHEDAETVQSIETHFESERGYTRCPACGADRAPGLAECASCGLGLGTGEEGDPAAACTHCEATLPEGTTTCPSCGRTQQG